MEFLRGERPAPGHECRQLLKDSFARMELLKTDPARKPA